jgi:hypothetical protein
MYFGASLINVLASFFVQLRASSPVIRIGKANSHGHRGFSSDMADHSASFGFCSVFLISLTGPEEIELEGPQPRPGFNFPDGSRRGFRGSRFSSRLKNERPIGKRRKLVGNAGNRPVSRSRTSPGNYFPTGS